MIVGRYTDGREVTYSEDERQFRIGEAPVSQDLLVEYALAGQITWVDARTGAWAQSLYLSGPVSTASTAQMSIERRYSSAYAVSRAVLAFGTVVKIAAGVTAGVAILLGLAAGAVSGGDSLTVVAGLAFAAFGVAAGVTTFILGILVSAQAQILRATLDTAVNSSPLLDPDEVRRIMSTS